MIDGKGAAWKQLTTPRNDLSNLVTQQEQLFNRHQQKKDLEEEKQAKDSLARQEKLKGVNPGKQTRYLNFEHSLTDAFMREGGLRDKYVDMQLRLKKNPADSEALAIKTNIEKTVDHIATIKNTILGYNQKLAEGIATGQISKNLNIGYLTNMEKINNGELHFDIDEFGSVKILNKGNIDLDGDGMPDELSLSSIADMNNFGIWQKDFDLSKFNIDLKKQFGELHTKKDNSNFSSQEYKGYNPAFSGDVKEAYRSVLGNDANSLTNDGKSLLYQRNISPNLVSKRPELYDQLINDLELEFRNLYANKSFNTIDHGARTARARVYSNKYSKGSKENKETNSLRTTVDGILAGDSRYLQSLKNQKLEEQGSDGKDIYIRDYEYSKNEDKIFLKLSNRSIKTIDLKEREQAIGQLLKFIRPNDDSDKREEEYRKGKVEVEYQEEDLSKKYLLEKSQIDDIPEKLSSKNFVERLKEIGIEATDKGSWFSSKVKIGDRIFDVTKEEGMIEAKRYIKNNFEKLTPKKQTPKENKKTKGVNDYGI